MGITVGELVAVPHLRLSVVAGAGGLDREVTWAHSSDLPAPWEWVGHGELLMINGMSFPAEAEQQAGWIARLAEVGVSALAIGEQMFCPELTPALRAESDTLGFPVLSIGFPLPFVAISRAVAEATLLEQSQRLIRTARIYDVLRRTTEAGGSHSTVADALSVELRAAVTVCDRETGAAFHPDGPHPSAEVREAVRAAGAGRVALVAGSRSVALPSGDVVLLSDIPTHDEAVLAVLGSTDLAVDGILLQHSATVAALELSQTRLALEHRRRAGAEAVALLLDGKIDQRAGRRHLADARLNPGACVVAAFADGPEERLHELHLRLWRARVPHMVMIRGSVGHALLSSSAEAVDVLVDAVGVGGLVGVSGILRSVARAPEASREALWALGAARQEGAAVHRFGQPLQLSGATSIEEAQSLVTQILQPVIDYDAEHQSELFATLTTFLDHRRSWRATADAMHVHRQTVLYRIRQVEKLTGRQLADTESLALVWLALRAWERLTGVAHVSGPAPRDG